MFALILGIVSLCLWLIILLLPWRPWSTREQLDATDLSKSDLSDVTVLIPARNEADVIHSTLNSLKQQGPGLKIIVIDDESGDDTAALARQSGIVNLELIQGQPSKPGWSGKLWALEQGRARVQTQYTLLLDADISLQANTLTTLKEKMEGEGLALLSLMACLKMETFWEKLLMPAFIYFFKLLYPFHLSNSSHPWVAAAAGGCILIKTEVMNDIGGFAAIKDALIDDCTLAKTVKQKGHKIWTGLTHSAVSLRSYDDLNSIWLMVTRTAFTQLLYSYTLLLLCVFLMTLAYIVPVINLVHPDWLVKVIALLTLLLLLGLYLPTLKFYKLNFFWALTMPLAGLLYLIMTVDSALKHSFGRGSEWKGRSYSKKSAPD